MMCAGFLFLCVFESVFNPRFNLVFGLTRYILTFGISGECCEVQIFINIRMCLYFFIFY